MVPAGDVIPSAICDSCPLASRRLCRALRDLPAGHRCRPRQRRVRAETTLQGQTECAPFAGILRRGYVRSEQFLMDGRRSVLGFFAPGDLIGTVPGSGRGPALVAASDAEICVLDPAALRGALQQNALLNAHFLAEAIRLHTRQLEMIWRRGALSSRERIAAFLVMAMEFMPTEPLPDGSVILSVKVSRKDWADFANTTVETICRTLADLAARDMLDPVAPGRYRIRDPGLLAQFAGLEPPGIRPAMLVDDMSGPPQDAATRPVPSRLTTPIYRIRLRLPGLRPGAVPDIRPR